MIFVDREYEGNATYLCLKDLSDGKETVPISLVNCVDANVKPDEFTYDTKRTPVGDVPLNTDPSLLEGCDCEDGCRDKSKCSCWQKTAEATEFVNLKSAYFDDSVEEMAQKIKEDVAKVSLASLTFSQTNLFSN